MKLKLPKLHNQILIALIAGAIFGSIFNVSRTSLIISYKSNIETESLKISNWDKFYIITGDINTDTLVFRSNQQIEILNYFKKVQSNGKNTTVVIEKYFSQESDKEVSIHYSLKCDFNTKRENNCD